MENRHRIKDLKGQRFGKLLVKEYVGSENKRSMWLCLCDCGKEKIISSKNILTNNVRSCGCLKEKGLIKGDVVKGACGNRLYKVYKDMIHRCYYPSEKEYKNYGGRGIEICEEWRNNFTNFCEWAYSNGYNKNSQFGECTIERINVNGNYEPSNCCFIPLSEQPKNRRNSKKNQIAKEMLECKDENT